MSVDWRHSVTVRHYTTNSYNVCPSNVEMSRAEVCRRNRNIRRIVLPRRRRWLPSVHPGCAMDRCCRSADSDRYEVDLRQRRRRNVALDVERRVLCPHSSCSQVVDNVTVSVDLDHVLERCIDHHGDTVVASA